MSTATHLDQFLDPLAEALSPEVAKRIVELRATQAQQARIDELASKANEGSLSEAEDAEYKDIIEAVDILSIIQLKARRFLAIHNRDNG
jgi:hypothetical protein